MSNGGKARGGKAGGSVGLIYHIQSMDGFTRDVSPGHGGASGRETKGRVKPTDGGSERDGPR